MTQTSDDSLNGSGAGNTSTSSNSSAVIMDHDKDVKVTDAVSPCSTCTAETTHESDRKLNEAAASPVIKAGESKVDSCAFSTTSRNTELNASISSNSPEGNCTPAEVGIASYASSSLSKAPMCAVCSEPCICYCKTCKNVSYCSKDHMKKHWKQHRSECFPVTVQVNSVFGSHLVVTRDIKRGEVILREKPLVVGPLLNRLRNSDRRSSTYPIEPSGKGNHFPYFPSVCLSCHTIICEQAKPSSTSSLSSCSQCGWPICCTECQKNPAHADQECRIFAEYQLEPSALCDKDVQYLCVALLRVLNHKKWNPTKWSEFMNVVQMQAPMKDGLNAHAEAKKSTARFSDLISKSLGSIIHNEFTITDGEIDQIVRTLRTTAFITDNDGNFINDFGFHTASNLSRYKGKTLSVYHHASMLTSNCIPNASWVIQETLEFYLRASTPIKTGERITITYVDPLVGTLDRRKYLWQEKYLSCSCSRCSDPTECQTFFSAIKCPGEGKAEGRHVSESNTGGRVTCECEGYMLPTDPLAVTYTWHEEVRNDDSPGEKLCEERMAEWKCNGCLMRQPWGHVQNSLLKLGINEKDHVVCFINGCSNGGGCSDGNDGDNKPEASNQNEPRTWSSITLTALQMRVDELEHFIGNHTHMNHYMVLKIENEVLSGISKLFEKGQVPFEDMEKWSLRMVDICKKGLKVVNVLCPGVSKQRGRLLYFLQQGLAISLLFKTSRAMRNYKGDSESSNNPQEISHEELVKKFHELILARKEILEIFLFEREHSEGKHMLQAVQQDSVEIRVLKNYFKCHQNIGCYSNAFRMIA